ncbi:hypothetical protein CRM22_001564 [Opisthorchis felineus]|uniref:Uncharacterized protein n=1 Tax=Opisthorchis felineus TaxID=147828 RepID=A0A4S2MA30_OPIFE|nr:hypothetical protein CRM22_001564 [Opisthorchis felineus]
MENPQEPVITKHLICSCCCFHLVRPERTVVDIVTDMKENALLDAKAGAVAGILFLQDDLFAYQRMAKMNKDAIMKQPMTVQEQEETLEALMPASFALKAYLKNNDRQIARLALLASLEPITM